MVVLAVDEDHADLVFGPGHGVKGGTIYLSAADERGMMVSFIQSNYMGFGSGVVVPGYGLSMQNRGHGFSLDAGSPNLVAPGKRPFHTIIPAFLTKGDASAREAVMSFGVMGANMQPQGHMQTLVRMLDHGQNPQAACDAPRWRFNEGLSINAEASMAPDVVQGLRDRVAGLGGSMYVISPPGGPTTHRADRRERSSSNRANRRSRGTASCTRAIRRGKAFLQLERGREIAPRYQAGQEVHGVDAYMDRANVAGLLVIRQEKIVLERYSLGLRYSPQRGNSLSVNYRAIRDELVRYSSAVGERPEIVAVTSTVPVEPAGAALFDGELFAHEITPNASDDSIPAQGTDAHTAAAPVWVRLADLFRRLSRHALAP